jgi:hypothetical protein
MKFQGTAARDRCADGSDLNGRVRRAATVRSARLSGDTEADAVRVWATLLEGLSGPSEDSGASCG